MNIYPSLLINAIHGKVGGWEIHKSKFGEAPILRMINPHVRRLAKGSLAASSCDQFSYADALYQTFTKEQRAEWRAAIKRPGIHAYGVWMMEALWHCQNWVNLPDHPGPSGGFSHGPLHPGEIWPPVGETEDKNPPEPEPPPEPPPPGPPDYFDCWACPDGTFTNFYGRLSPRLDNCNFKDWCDWQHFRVMPGECLWTAWPLFGVSSFDLWMPGGLININMNPPGPVNFQLGNADDNLCLGGFFNTLIQEPSFPCEHGPHDGFTFEIWWSEY